MKAPTARREASGIAQLSDGRAEVSLPDHFGLVTDDDEDLVVQTTPYRETDGLKITERSTDRIVVEELGEGAGNIEFSYTIKGTRDGFADKEVVREPRDLDETRAHSDETDVTELEDPGPRPTRARAVARERGRDF